jgi:hypothetical protein
MHIEQASPNGLILIKDASRYGDREVHADLGPASSSILWWPFPLIIIGHDTVITVKNQSNMSVKLKKRVMYMY